MSELDELVKKYDLAPTPQSVARLGELVMKRNADIQEIIKVISSDIALKIRLLRAASPSDGHVKVESVQEAVFRTGVGCVLVLAMSDPLIKALMKTFMTLLSIRLQPVDPASVPGFTGTQYLGSAKFAGKASGVVYLRIGESFARYITAQVLATSSSDEISEGVKDVLGELVNMVVGNFKSNLCDAGLSCKLSLPEVSRISEFRIPAVSGGRHQVFAFCHQSEPVLVNIFVNSTE